MHWDLHGQTISGSTNNDLLRERWRASFASRSISNRRIDLSFALDLVADIPARPIGEPHYRQADLLEYTIDGQNVVAHFPRFGQLRLDLVHGLTEGHIVDAALNTYGVLEDLIAIGLSPHLRRRGMFLIHAFGAATADPHPRPRPLSLKEERGVLLVGNIGAGKTTTGMSLLDAGWKLLSNDSPIVKATGEVLSYPSLLAAYPDTFDRFERSRKFAQTTLNTEGRQKITLSAELIWPDVWIDRAMCCAIFFPQIESRSDHAIDPIDPPEALRRLLPHAIEQWDREMIAEHLKVLKNLVENAPAYLLRLGSQVKTIPAQVISTLNQLQ
ncbi:MAG TPA: hypothetical protein VFF70_15325 [Anaerolineae bacterium]|nr:hypothetical protein [Anaerolineae bacterium]